MTLSTLAGLALIFAAPVDVPGDDVLAALKQFRQGEGFQRVAEGGYWYSFALEQGDSMLVWPAGAAAAVTLRDGTELAAVEAMAMSPPPGQRITRLGGQAVALEPSSLWRRRFRNRGIYTVIFARFDRPFSGSLVLGARVQVHAGAAAPTPAIRGAP